MALSDENIRLALLFTDIMKEGFQGGEVEKNSGRKS